MAGIAPHFLTFANEKGGTGKSTTAVHVAVALAAQGRTRRRARSGHAASARSAAIWTTALATVRRLGLELPMPAHDTFDPAKGEEFDAAHETRGARAPIS